MTALAYHEGELMTSYQLAKSVRTNPTVVRRLVAKLSEAGLLDSYKGKSGGVRISKNPKDITLKEIYMAVSGKKFINAPDKEPDKKCAVSCSMGSLLSEVIEGLERQSLKYLSTITICDLRKQVSKS